MGRPLHIDALKGFLPVQVVYFVGVQLDITLCKKRQRQAQQSSARKQAESAVALSHEGDSSAIASSVERWRGNESAQDLSEADKASSSQAMPASLERLNGGAHIVREKPEPREDVGPREKQMQRSVVGTVCPVKRCKISIAPQLTS